MKNLSDHVGNTVQTVLQAVNSAAAQINKAVDSMIDLTQEAIGRNPQLAFAAPDATDPLREVIAPVLSSGSSKGSDKQRLSLPQQRRLVVDQFGVSKKVAAALDRKGLSQLAGLLNSGPATAKAALDMLNAVAETSPGRERELVSKLATYPGRMDILVTFLRHFGTNDPFVATADARVDLLPGEGESVRGVSGHMLHGAVFAAFRKGAATSTIGFQSQRTAITRICEAFNPECFSPEVYERRARRRNAILRDEIGDVTLADIEEDDNLAKDLKSPLIARNLTVYRELREAIAQYKRQLDSMTRGGKIVLSSVCSFKVRTDPGGGFFGWFDRQAEEGMVFPEGIAIALEAIRDPLIELSEKEERDYTNGLIAYIMVHSYISKEAALGGLISDFNEFQSLAPNDPLRLDLQLDSAFRELQRVAADGSTEMSLADLSALLSLTAFDSFRQSRSAQIMERYPEFPGVLERFEFLFMQEGRLREDCVQGSVPMERMRKTLYGAKIAVQDPRDHDSQKRAVLGQPDFKAILDGLFFRTTSHGDPELMLLSQPIAYVRRMVEGGIVAGRKADPLDVALAEYLAKNPTGDGSQIQINREDIGDALGTWKPVLPLGRGYKPIESLSLPDDVSSRLALSPAQVVDCVRKRKLLGVADDSQKLDRLHSEVSLGLYKEEEQEFLQKLAAIADRFKPIADYPQMVADVEAVLESPLVYPNPGFPIWAIRSGYALPTELLELQAVAAKRKDLEASGLSRSAETESLAEEIRQRRGCKVYSGGIDETRGVRRLKLTRMEMVEFLDQQQLVGVSYIDPKRAAEKLSLLEEGYISAHDQSQAWLQRLQHLCSKSAAEELKAQGLGLVDFDTNSAAKQLTDSFPKYLDNGLVGLVDKIASGQFAEADRAAARSGRIGRSHHFEWRDVGGKRVPVFGFGQYKDRPIAEVVDELKASGRSDPLSYLSNYILRSNFPAHVKEIAGKITEIARTEGGFSAELFESWLEERATEWQ